MPILQAFLPIAVFQAQIVVSLNADVQTAVLFCQLVTFVKASCHIQVLANVVVVRFHELTQAKKFEVSQ